MNIRTQITNKLLIIYGFIVLFAILIIGQILYLQNWKKEELEKDVSTTKEKIIPANRGDILANDYRVLATSMPTYNIKMDPTVSYLTDSMFNNNIDSLSACLAKLFNDSTKEGYAKKIKAARDSNNSYMLIKNRVSYRDLQQIKQFPILKLGKNKGGLIVEREFNRIYPHDYLALRTIGYTNENNYKVGIEGAYNEVLAGKDGYKLMQKIPGNTWKELSYKDAIEPVDGMDVITTIDVNIQDIVDKALRKQLIKFDAEWGTAILMEVKTGEIRAICNLQKIKDSVYRETDNYAICEAYEPGSTFKLPAIIADFEKGNLNLDDIIDTRNGVLKIGDFIIHDHKKGGFGKITVQQIFEHSSNVGMSLLAVRQFKESPKDFIDILYGMGLNEKLGVEILGEANPDIKYPEGNNLWSGISLMQMSQGYELKITPLQILAFFNAVANNGILLRPLFVKAYREHGEIVKTFEAKILNSSICSEETLKKAHIILKGVVERGTAQKHVKSKSVKIAGKTGTAQIATGSQGYVTEQGVFHNASFVGYFPADNPKYSCIVLVHKPTRYAISGGTVAGPAFKEIAEKLYATDHEMQKDKIFELALFKINPELPKAKTGFKKFLNLIFYDLNILVDNTFQNKSQWVKPNINNTNITYSDIYMKNGLVPNVIGMGARDAIYLLENAGLIVTIIGKGAVIKQSVKPDTKFEKGDLITITLKL